MTFENPEKLTLVEKELTIEDTMNELADIQLAQKKIIAEKGKALDIIKGGDPTLVAEIQAEITEAENKLDDATNKLRALIEKKAADMKKKDEKYSVDGPTAAWDDPTYRNGNGRSVR